MSQLRFVQPAPLLTVEGKREHFRGFRAGGIARYKGGGGGGIGKILSVAAPIVLSIAAPGLGTAIGAGLGLSGTAASVVGSALLGAGMGGLTSGLTGGKIGQGMLGGALGGALGAGVGGVMGNNGFSPLASSMTGNAVGGAASSAVRGENPLMGAAMGAAQGAGGAMLGGLGSVAGGDAPAWVNPDATPDAFGNYPSDSTVHTDPRTHSSAPGPAPVQSGGALSAPTAAMPDISPEITTSIVDSVQSPLGAYAQQAPGPMSMDDMLQQQALKNAGYVPAPAGTNLDAQSGVMFGPGGAYVQPEQSILGRGVDWVKEHPWLTAGGVLGAATLLGGSGQPEQPKQANVSVDRGLAGQPLPQYNMQRTAYAYPGDVFKYGQSTPSWTYFSPTTFQPVATAKEGGLMPPLHYVKGGNVRGPLSNGGQDDVVPALLAPGEYVIPADVVSHLGDGTTEAGGKKLDGMVKSVRQHRGTRSNKLPPRAKSPLAYATHGGR